MPRTRGGLRGVRYDPIFGPAQAPDTAPGYNVPRGITFEQLRNIANIARQRNEPAISVKNQIRAIIAAAGLTSAAAGALTMRAFQYVDNKFGKRPRDTDASQAGDNHSRLRGVKEARTIDPQLPDYEDVSSREDDFVETAGNKFSDSIDAAVALQDDEDFVEEIERQEQEDQNIRNVLLNMRGDDGDIDIDVRDQHQSSFDDLPSGPQVNQEPLHFDPDVSEMPVEIHDDVQMEENNSTTARVSAMGARGAPGSAANTATPIARMSPTFPFHQTEQAILEYHGSISTHLYKVGQDHALRVRMNTYVQPFAETSGSVVSQPSWGPVAIGWANQSLGRYCFNPGLTGALIEQPYNRELIGFIDPMFNDGNFTSQIPRGAPYYNLHWNAYTVTKCEWMIRVEVPFHYMKGTYETDDAPSVAQVKGSMVGNTEWGDTSTSSTSARVFTHYIMTGDAVSAVNPPVNANVLEMEQWENTYDNKVTVPVNQSRTIRGTWYPGKVKHNPLNDDDIQRWSTTGQVPPQSHLEELVVQVKERGNSNSVNNTVLGANITLRVKWFVQFKERKSEIQYPRTGQTNPTGTAINAIVLQTTSGSTTYP